MCFLFFVFWACLSHCLLVSFLFSAFPLPSAHGVCLQQDDTFDDSSIFSYGSVGSAATNGGTGGRLPSSPSTLGAMEQSDDEEDDDELRGRWGNNGVVVGGGDNPDAKQGDVSGSLFLMVLLGYEFASTLGRPWPPDRYCAAICLI